ARILGLLRVQASNSGIQAELEVGYREVSESTAPAFDVPGRLERLDRPVAMLYALGDARLQAASTAERVADAIAIAGVPAKLERQLPGAARLFQVAEVLVRDRDRPVRATGSRVVAGGPIKLECALRIVEGGLVVLNAPLRLAQAEKGFGAQEW